MKWVGSVEDSLFEQSRKRNVIVPVVGFEFSPQFKQFAFNIVYVHDRLQHFFHHMLALTIPKAHLNMRWSSNTPSSSKFKTN